MNEMKLWYVRSAEQWEESLPIGNGSLGAMIKGGTDEEILGLNEESLWSGYYKDKNNPGAAAQLEEVRRLIFAGKNKEAERLIQKSMLGEFNESYLPLGSLSLRFSYEGETAAADYRRELDIDHACARVAYSCCGTHYEREYFASYPARAICIRLKADRAAMDFTMSFASELEHTCEAKQGGLEIAGRCPEHVDPSYIPLREDSVVQGTRGKAFTAAVRILECDGLVENTGDRIRVSGASVCVLILSAVKEPALPENASYDSLKAEHIRDYEALYGRVELYLGEQKALGAVKKGRRGQWPLQPVFPVRKVSAHCFLQRRKPSRQPAGNLELGAARPLEQQLDDQY